MNLLKTLWLTLCLWNTYNPRLMRDWRRYCRDSNYYPGYDPIPCGLQTAWEVAWHIHLNIREDEQ